MLNKEEIKKIIPQREPFLMIDEVEEYIPGESAVAYKNVTEDEYYFKGHFPGNPIMPCVLITESLAQTGAVAILSKEGSGPFITHITPGKIVDMGIKDANNMGAAMAPALSQTLITHFLDTGRSPNYYDAIISGDLGHIGKSIAIDILKNNGYNIKPNYDDCGVLIFDKNSQDTHSGGSGCACCATIFSGYFFKQLKEKKLKKILLIATGALMNSTSSQQGESIPGIAHAISIEL